jgi:hypothetical protein
MCLDRGQVRAGQTPAHEVVEGGFVEAIHGGHALGLS